MKKFEILVIYKANRIRRYYIVAENEKEMWKMFNQHHDKNTIEEASIIGWGNVTETL